MDPRSQGAADLLDPSRRLICKQKAGLAAAPRCLCRRYDGRDCLARSRSRGARPIRAPRRGNPKNWLK